MKSRLLMGLALLLLAPCIPGQAQTLNTAQDNNGSGGVFLNLQAVDGPVTITGFDAPILGASGTQVAVDVWVRAGAYAGFTGSSDGWTLTQTVTGAVQPLPVRTPFVLTSPIVVPAAEVTAVYLHSIAPGPGLRYTGNTNSPPQTAWSNDDLSLFSDTARTGAVPFAGNLNSPRAFSGVIRYRNELATAAQNNGSGGVFLSLQAVDQDLTVTAFDVPLSPIAGTVVSVEVWTRPGGYAGFTADSAGWTLTQTVDVTAAGVSTPAPMVLRTPIPVSPDQATAVYLHAVFPAASGSGIRYTGNSDVPPQTAWSNGDLMLFSDTARTGFVAFGGGQNSPRTFSGRIRYTKAFETAPSDNGNGGIFFDLQPVRQSLNLTGFDVPMAGIPGTPTLVEVWTRAGSYGGFTSSNAGWTLNQTVAGTAQGATVAAPYLLDPPIHLRGNTTTAIYLHAIGAGTGINYTGTKATPPQTLWSNSGLVLFSDTARTGGVPFGGGAATPRTFSGGLRYTVELFANGFE